MREAFLSHPGGLFVSHRDLRHIPTLYGIMKENLFQLKIKHYSKELSSCSYSRRVCRTNPLKPLTGQHNYDTFS